MQVLIAEDEAMIADLYVDAVEDLGGHVVGVAARAEDALATARTVRVDVALLDVRLAGDMDGIELAYALLAEQPAARVVFVTGSGDPGTRARIVAARPFAFLLKPVGPGELADAIRRAYGPDGCRRDAGGPDGCGPDSGGPGA